ncbi:hypothetical protein, partial [Achromobacter sp. Marseille-Q4962]|uniref:hypothetical protein n=1 Tax=Achromobacter sp. Marseille-Q4962 TaxID=2942202 RepID=UPI0020748D6B
MKLKDKALVGIRCLFGSVILQSSFGVSAGVILTHPVGVNLTHLGNDGGFLATDNVDSGASSGDQGNG